MLNEAADIVQDQPETTPEWKAKARIAGTAAVEASRAAYQEIQNRTVEYSRATDQAIRQSPYKALGIVFGIGCLLGFMFTRGSKRSTCED